MNTLFTISRGKLFLSVTVLVATVAALAVAGIAQAAPPMTVGYVGSPVTTAVPGKPFTMKFQVKNTSSEQYSGVKVIFHIPDGLTHSKVSPGSAEIIDDTITWSNQTFASGKAFYPSFTFTLAAGTPLKTKRNIWVEVIGTDMEATSKNFSVTAKSSVVATTSSTLSSADISSMFQEVYGRTATASELKYWLGRRSDKPQRTALLGAMGYHKANNIAH